VCLDLCLCTKVFVLCVHVRVCACVCTYIRVFVCVCVCVYVRVREFVCRQTRMPLGFNHIFENFCSPAPSASYNCTCPPILILSFLDFIFWQQSGRMVGAVGCRWTFDIGVGYCGLCPVYGRRRSWIWAQVLCVCVCVCGCVCVCDLCVYVCMYSREIQTERFCGFKRKRKRERERERGEKKDSMRETRIQGSRNLFFVHTYVII